MDTNPNQVAGGDIGGANLKYARADGRALARVFPMWRQPEQLADAIREDLERLADTAAPIQDLAVTMTGEIADCFVDRADGVNHIVHHTLRAAEQLGIANVVFYGVDGHFHEPQDAAQNVDKLAAANWHALASYVAAEVCGEGILIDVGSTTTDIVPLSGGHVNTSALTDHDRLVEGTLVYVGCRRTPVCALVDRLCWGETTCPIMNEVFATMDDVRLLVGTEPQDKDDYDSADGKPRTREFAANRLARMIGLDRRTIALADAEALASQVMSAARGRIADAVERNYHSGRVVISGHGEDLITGLAEREVVRLEDVFGADAARCAPSLAVARLLLNRSVAADRR